MSRVKTAGPNRVSCIGANGRAFGGPKSRVSPSLTHVIISHYPLHQGQLCRVVQYLAVGIHRGLGRYPKAGVVPHHEPRQPDCQGNSQTTPCYPLAATVIL